MSFTMGLVAVLASAKSAKLVAAGAGGGLIGIGGSLIAQVTLEDLGILPQLGAGAVIGGAGIYALRVVLRAAAHERETATENEERLTRALDRAERRLEDLNTELDAANRRARRLLIAYDRERAHRIALENAGIVERRHTPDELLTETLLEEGDLEAIGVDPTELETPPEELNGR